MKVIYLDNNATTQCAPAVVEAMLPYFSEKYGNASSMHAFGGNNRHAIDAARQQVAALIGAAHADEIIFTSCATESDNTAIFSAVRTQPKKKHIITSAVEHPAVMEPYKYLEAQGYRVDFIGVDEKGRFDMARFQRVLDEDTALVSVMWANSETGTIFPIEDIARLSGGGYAFAFRPQIPRAQRRGRFVCAPRYAVYAVFDGRPPGTSPPRRNGKRPLYRGAGQSVRTGAETLGGRYFPKNCRVA